ncbi:MAG TPA: cobalamin biosynthesis protein CobW, partial [Pseudomonas sp.]|nr:cobalamin biosynthesis protein CobW [Pseudomonas sp.]
LWSSQGRMDFTQLPGHAVKAGVAAAELAVPAAPMAAGSLWLEPRVPICQTQQQAEGWSIGWRWHPSQRFELLRVQQWLAGLAWRRAKLVLQTNAGWLSANALDGEAPHWRSSEWRKDSRLELIFATAQDEDSLRRSLDACRLGD